jgi:shikimate dehydrogenase
MTAVCGANELRDLEQHLANTFEPAAFEYARFAGIIGDRPSQYAKSPTLWNAAFRGLALDAVFLPFDVDEPKLGAVVDALRQSTRLLGFSVTVPYKVRILDLLDTVDPKAAAIGAVNTVVRTPEGRLVGFNTDGSGFLASLTTAVVDTPLFESPLKGIDALLIGAGGAARAVAFYLAEQIAPGRLIVANRTPAAARELAAAVSASYGNSTAVDEREVEELAPRVRLIVNSSTRGQSGLRKLAGDTVTTLEPYSALAPATAPPFPADADPARGEGLRRWYEAALPGIADNTRRSLALAARIPESTVAFDLVYAPTETVFLRHLRYSGHRTANGKGMNIAQAVDAFCDRVCPALLAESGLAPATARTRVTAEMSRVW